MMESVDKITLNLTLEEINTILIGLHTYEDEVNRNENLILHEIAVLINKLCEIKMKNYESFV